MQITLNSCHFMFHHVFIKPTINKFFMSCFFNNMFMNSFAFLISSPSTAINEYIFNFNATTNYFSFEFIFHFNNYFLIDKIKKP